MATKTRPPASRPEEEHNPGQDEFDKIIDKNFSPGDERMMEERAKKGAAGPDELADAEKAAGDAKEAEGAKDETDRLQSEHENPVGSGYTGSGQGGGKTSSTGRFRFKITKKKGIGAGIIAAIVAAALALFTITSGPLQLLHLAQILKKSWHHQEGTSTARAKGLFRYYRTGNIGETRVGWVGSKIFANLAKELGDIGVTFTDLNANGTPKGAIIDTNKHPEFKDVPLEQRQALLGEVFSTDLFKPTGEPGVFSINFPSDIFKGINFERFFLKTSIDHLQGGAIETALQFRVATRFYDLPSLFHPLKRATAEANFKLGAVAETATESAKEEETREGVIEDAALKEVAIGDVASGEDAAKSLQDKFKDAGSWAGSGLLGLAALCTIRSATSDVTAYNRGMIILPAVLQAVDKMSVGSQTQSGEDFFLGQVGAIVEGFKDPKTGKTIWNSKPLQVLAGNPNPGGQDLPARYGKVFSGSTTADNLKKQLDKYGATDFWCSNIGQAIQAILNVGLLGLGAFSFGGSWAMFLAEQSAQLAAFAAIMYALQTELVDILKGSTVVPAVLSGPVGGSLLAYGSREGANISARASGGTAMPGTSTTTLTYAEQKADEEQFQSEPLAKRLFDTHDYRSTISRFIDSANPSPTQNLNSVANLFTHPGRLFSGAFGFISPHANAAVSYHWGFPQYGIQDSLATDPNYEDPYANADYVAAKLLDTNAVDIHGSMTYITKAYDCFGVSINKDADSHWQVVAEEDVDPDSDTYHSANCDDGNAEWQRMKLFVFDSRLMDSIGCYRNDATSCANLNTSNGSGTTTTSTTTGGTGAGTGGAGTGAGGNGTGSGNTSCVTDQQLAQQILSTTSISYPLDGVSPNGSTQAVLQAVGQCQPAPVTCTDGTTGGVTSTTLSSNMLKFVLELGQQTSIGVNALSDKCHTTGSLHYQGLAVDFECIGISFNVALADSIASKYGGARNSETCSANSHWHYQFSQ